MLVGKLSNFYIYLTIIKTKKTRNYLLINLHVKKLNFDEVPHETLTLIEES